MAPLIDVVFLLIIFYAVVSHLTRMEPEAVRLPEATEGVSAEQAADRKLVVNVFADGRVKTAGKECSPAELERELEERIGRVGKEKLELVIRGDRLTPWSSVAEIMRIASRHGLARQQVAVLEPGS